MLGAIVTITAFIRAFRHALGRRTEITIHFRGRRSRRRTRSWFRRCLSINKFIGRQIKIVADKATMATNNSWHDRHYLTHSIHKLDSHDAIFAPRKNRYWCTVILSSVLGTYKWENSCFETSKLPHGVGLNTNKSVKSITLALFV